MRLTVAPIIDWTGRLDRWLDPLAAYLKAGGAFAIRLGPPVRTDSWTAARIKAGIADPGVARLTDLPSSSVEPVGSRVTRQLHEAGWPHVYRAFDVYLRRREQLRRRGK